jgi:hypothetical protein
LLAAGLLIFFWFYEKNVKNMCYYRLPAAFFGKNVQNMY